MRGTLTPLRFRFALSRERVELHYQPIIEHGSGSVVAAEALVRWRHPRHGLIPPEAFIPRLEGTRTERVLNHAVIERAAAQGATWQSANRPLQIAVNVSPPSLDLELRDAIASALASTRLAPELLHIELTERGDGIEDGGDYLDALTEIRALGVTVSLDDFGRARSSLTRLTTLPVDMVKIDRGFVTALNDSKSAEVLRSAIRLAHALGLKVVAEGVETEAQWHRLQGWGSDFAQGFLLSPALPADELTRWIDDSAPRMLARLRDSAPFVERRTGFPDRRRFSDRRGLAPALRPEPAR